MGLKTFVNERERERKPRDTIQQGKIMLLVEPFVISGSGRKKKKSGVRDW